MEHIESAHRPLSRRQSEVASLLTKGLRSKEIAAALGCSYMAVRVSLSRIRRKDPAKADRYLAAIEACRDQERRQAVRLNEWIRKWRTALPPEALDQVEQILAEQIASAVQS